MAADTTQPLTYLNGHSGSKGLLGLLAFPSNFPSETEFTLFLTTRDSQWRKLQFDFDIVSLTHLKINQTGYKGWWLLGKRGETVEVISGNTRMEKITTAGTESGCYGYLSQIRLINNTMFICGYRRQVYQRKDQKWVLISSSMLDNRPEGPWNGLESIDGFSQNDIYAVGDEGEIWHYDGSNWTACDSPTNQNLADVRCIAGEVWICGDSGIILRGNKDGWDIVWDGQDPSDNWWSIESFQGDIYIAGNDFLGKLLGDKVVPVNIGIKPEITTQILHHKDGILWSIGEEDILAYDGKNWRELKP